MDMKLEVVVVPVSDVHRAKQFYKTLGRREDADVVGKDDFRLVQMTPPGSGCSIHFGTGIGSEEPGSAGNLFLAGDDIEAARAELVGHGVDVGEIVHDAGGQLALHADPTTQAPGLDPERRSYASYAPFTDPDGNRWWWCRPAGAHPAGGTWTWSPGAVAPPGRRRGPPGTPGQRPG